MGNYPEEEYPEKELTEKIIGAAFRVHNRLGHSFLEKVYENALVKELQNAGGLGRAAKAYESEL